MKGDRIWAPAGSFLVHAAIIAVLLSFMREGSRSAVANIEATLAVAPDVPLDTLDEIIPQEPVGQVEPMAPEDVNAQGLGDSPVAENTFAESEMTVASQASPDILFAESPLKLLVGGFEFGRDKNTLQTLQSGYGARAAQNGLLGSYFNRIDFDGKTFTRIDETLNKQWEAESPWPGKIGTEFFSIIWTGRIVPRRSGRYTIYLQSDDGARLWINGNVVLNQFTEHSRQWDSVELDLLAGLSYDIKYAFCEVTIFAISQLEWSCEGAGISRQLIPTDCLWADGPSSAEMLRWNERRGGYANRRDMANPGLVDGQPFSHVVNYDSLNEELLVRLKLEDLLPEFHRVVKQGHLPPLRVNLVREVQPMRTQSADEGGEKDEVVIEIL